MYVPAFVIRNVIREAKKSLMLHPKNATEKVKSKNTPALSIQEKLGKRYLVINPDSPLIQGFANVDNQFASFEMPDQNSGTFFNMNGFPSVQLPTNFGPTNFGRSPFGTSSVFPSNLAGPYSAMNAMKLNGLPLLGGQTDSGGLFRGFVAVPITTRFPMSGFSGFGRMIGTPSLPSQQLFPPFGSQLAFHDSYRQNYPTPISPNYLPNLYRSSEYQQPIYPSQPDFQQSVYGNRPLDFGYESNLQHETSMDQYHSQNIDLNEQQEIGDHAISGRNREGNFDSDDERNKEDHFAPMFGGNFGGISDRNRERNFDSGEESDREDHVASMFGGNFGERSQFEDNFRRNQMPFERNLGMENFPQNLGMGNAFKRSSTFAHPIKPFVFTKEHVGFGPITVEAHTASYRGDDPKDDQ